MPGGVGAARVEAGGQQKKRSHNKTGQNLEGIVPLK